MSIVNLHVNFKCKFTCKTSNVNVHSQKKILGINNGGKLGRRHDCPSFLSVGLSESGVPYPGIGFAERPVLYPPLACPWPGKVKPRGAAGGLEGAHAGQTLPEGETQVICNTNAFISAP